MKTPAADGRRHGIHALPVCIQRSNWSCTVESDDALRLGFNQVQGLRRPRMENVVQARAAKPFRSLDDFRRRSGLAKDDLRALARVGALNAFCGHRRAALWEVERELPEEVELFARIDAVSAESGGAVPLQAMNPVERMQADYRSQRLTIGPHPMKFMRGHLPGVWRARDVATATDGDTITIAGAVICRQRPGTAKGFLFVSLEDESGVSNAVVPPALFEAERLTITQESFLRITGPVQNRRGLPLVRAVEIGRVVCPQVESIRSYDFH